jgi:hypothetical protein
MCHDYAPSFLSVVELFFELELVLLRAVDVFGAAFFVVDVDFFVVDDFEAAGFFFAGLFVVDDEVVVDFLAAVFAFVVFVVAFGLDVVFFAVVFFGGVFLAADSSLSFAAVFLGAEAPVIDSICTRVYR